MVKNTKHWRLGPNQVGQQEIVRLHINKLFRSYHPFSKFIKISQPYLTFSNQSRSFHSNNSPPGISGNAYKIIAGLYKSRLAPVISFNHPVLINCPNITDPAEKDLFFKKLSDLIAQRQENDLGVIYIFKYIHDPNVYYIGRTNSLRGRLSNHLSKYWFDKFHTILRSLGLSNFSLSVIEIDNYHNLIERENYYLALYKPLLNTVFRSVYSSSIKKIWPLIDSVKALKLTNELSNNLEKETLLTQIIWELIPKGRL